LASFKIRNLVIVVARGTKRSFSLADIGGITPERFTEVGNRAAVVFFGVEGKPPRLQAGWFTIRFGRVGVAGL
jgi:hypothetical protein